jgi:ORF6N domain
MKADEISPCILRIRGKRVVLDADLARIYGTTTSRLNQQVTRNRDRFPEDFMFRLQQHEKTELVTNRDILRNIKYSRVLPRVFTEHGAIMVASVLNSPRAVEMSVFVVRAFVHFRSILANHTEFSDRLTELESKIARHDESIRSIVTALRELLQDDRRSQNRAIGFRSNKE